MLRQWEQNSRTSSEGPQFCIQDDLKTLAFHILNRAGFGVRLQWSGLSASNKDGTVEDVDANMALDGNKLEGGHGMRFGEAMLIVVDHLKELFIFPKWVLSEQLPTHTSALLNH